MLDTRSSYTVDLETLQIPAIKQKTLAVIIPTLNEGKTVSRVISHLRALLPHANVVVVDGGSKDDTVSRAKKANASVIIELRKGYGRAIRTGIERTPADVYAIVDADETYDISKMGEMVKIAETGKLVVGARVKTQNKSMSFSHVVGNITLSLIYRLMFRHKLTDTQSGFKIFPVEVAKGLRENGMTLSSEVLMAARNLSLEVREVPVAYRGRQNGSSSKFSFWSDGMRVLLFLISPYRRNNSSS